MLYIILSVLLNNYSTFKIIKIDNNESILLTLILVGKYNSTYIFNKQFSCPFL